jgi:transcriptional regulator with XRE-family HTH domain
VSPLSQAAYRAEVARTLRRAIGTKKQAEAARELGISRQLLNLYLREKATPKPALLAKACKKWGMKFSYAGIEIPGNATYADNGQLRPNPVQLSLFQAIDTLRDADIAVKIDAKQSDTVRLKLELRFGT